MNNNARMGSVAIFNSIAILAVAPFAVCAVAGCAKKLQAADDSPGWNLLIVQTDEHNFRTLGCYRDIMSPEQALMWGLAVVETPNLDWLAKNGALCTSFYATTPVCSPSRAALTSGRYPQHTDVVTNNIPLNDNIVTFAEILRRRGYATGFAGKWHLDGSGKPQWAPRRNFGFEDNRYMFNRGHWKQLEDTPDGPRIAARNGAAPNYSIKGANRKNFTTDFLADKTIDFINEHRNEEFCYWVSFPDPHGPDTVRSPYDTMYRDQTYTKPRTFEKAPGGAPKWGLPTKGGFNQASYYGMVRCIDDNLGRIIESLRANGILERTIIVFTSDHGDLRGEHHRQNKGIPYEGSARIPFLMVCHGQIKPGTIINEALSCIDFQPTILAMMGIQPSGQEDGRNAVELFRTGRAPENWRDIAFLRGTGKAQGWLTVVTDRYKLVYSPIDMPWMFDLQRDPDEVTNFFTHPGYRDIVHDLSKSLRQYGSDEKDPFIDLPRIKADLDWAIHGTGPYRAP